MDTNKLNLDKPEKNSSKISKTITANAERSKMLSLRTSQTSFAKFTAINKYYGMSNNSVINKLIVDYIREHQDILDELGIE